MPPENENIIKIKYNITESTSKQPNLVPLEITSELSQSRVVLAVIISVDKKLIKSSPTMNIITPTTILINICPLLFIYYPPNINLAPIIAPAIAIIIPKK